MHRLRLRFPHILLASVLAVSAAAIAEPPPPAAAPGPVPAPYPNAAARDAASGLATGKRMHKPFVVTAEAETLDVRSVSWAAPGMAAANRLSSDPEEGGQVYSADPQEGGQVYSADPQEGGQVTARPRAKVHVSDISVSKRTDTASTKLLAEPAPSGTATVTVARGMCATGKHFPAVKIVTRSASYMLHDVDASDCTDSGDTTTCVLTYQSVGS